MGGILQGADLGPDCLQIRRGSGSHLHFIHWYWKGRRDVKFLFPKLQDQLIIILPFFGSSGVSGVLASRRDLDELRDLLSWGCGGGGCAALVGRVNPGILEGDFWGEFGEGGPFRSFQKCRLGW